MNNEKIIRWGIIGCGNVTEVKSGPAFRLIDHSDLVAVMRRNGKLAEDYARRHKVKKWFTNAEALVKDEEVDAIYIATPPGSHLEYTRLAAAHGKPVYVEKPMARTYAESQEMITVCKAAGVPLFVAYYRRALPRFLAIKNLIDNGEIGKVRFVNVLMYKKAVPAAEAGWRVVPEISGGGLFVDLASHQLDLLQFYFGDIISADGYSAHQAADYAVEDHVSGTFIFASGVHGTGIWNFAAYADEDKTEIVGDRGKITFATFGNSPIEVVNGKGSRLLDLPNMRHIEQPLIQTVVDELRGVGRCPSTGITAARTNRAMDLLRR
ncbi:MAG TPA: Gfo/Idh/MocA family oxidoreductase [Bacteroidales bacterium]|nr:Gfo/Idh/MocA family oxidoreductase [Bacteroidales bacterium]